MGFTAAEKMDLFSMCAGIMHVGRATFKQRPREENAEPDNVEGCTKACAQWKCDSDAFVRSLTKPRVKVGTEWVNKGQNLEQVSRRNVHPRGG